jgi:hypothetical protein
MFNLVLIQPWKVVVLNQGKCMCFGRDWPKPGTYAGACLVCWPCQSTPSLGWLTWRSSCGTKSKSSTGSIAAGSSWGTEEPLPRHHIPANQWLQVTETTYSWMNYVSPGTCLIFFLTTKLCTTLPFSILPTQCSYIGPPLHHSDLWVCHSQAMIGSFSDSPWSMFLPCPTVCCQKWKLLTYLPTTFMSFSTSSLSEAHHNTSTAAERIIFLA